MSRDTAYCFFTGQTNCRTEQFQCALMCTLPMANMAHVCHPNVSAAWPTFLHVWLTKLLVHSKYINHIVAAGLIRMAHLRYRIYA